MYRQSVSQTTFPVAVAAQNYFDGSGRGHLQGTTEPAVFTILPLTTSPYYQLGQGVGGSAVDVNSMRSKSGDQDNIWEQVAGRSVFSMAREQMERMNQKMVQSRVIVQKKLKRFPECNSLEYEELEKYDEHYSILQAVS